MKPLFIGKIRGRVINETFLFIQLVREGAHLYKAGIDPYAGDLYHENPLILITSNFLINYLEPFIPYVFILCDLVCGALLFQMAKNFSRKMVNVSAFFFFNHLYVFKFNEILWLCV